jgi:glycosyltransferase involved in cell wall biosynthesis
MNTAVDATCWQNQRGYGRHARALLNALTRLDQDNRYTFFMDAAPQAGSIPAGVDLRLIAASSPAALSASANGHRSFSDMWRMSRALSDPGHNLILFPTVYTYVPVLSRAKKIVMIHDVIAEKLPHLTLPERPARLFWNAKVALSRRQADAIVTVSDYSRAQIADHFHIDREQIFVVGEASDPVFRALEGAQLTPCLISSGVPDEARLLVYVGGFGPHKNLEMLVNVFARVAARPEFDDVRLILVGEYQKEVFYSSSGSLQSQIEALGISNRVIFTGYLPDEELVVLLNLATGLVLPSLMEGFGLPAIEAAACGCPVIATQASPLPALLGAGGLFVDPYQPEALEAAVSRVLASETLRQEMRSAGLQAANALTWEAAARQLMEVIRWTGQA